MSTDFEIREANKIDIERLREIADLSFPRFFRYFAGHSLESEGQVFLAEFQGIIIGFVKLIEFRITGVFFGCVLWLVVHPDFRRRGFGSKLVAFGTDYLLAHGAEAVFASVQRRNSASLAVLQRMGFKRMGLRGLRRMFGWRIFELYWRIWLAPGEVVLMKEKA